MKNLKSLCQTLRKQTESYSLHECFTIFGILKLRNVSKQVSIFNFRVCRNKSDFQLKVLNEIFKINKYPNNEIRMYLSILLNLSPRCIQVWFQNSRRAIVFNKQLKFDKNTTVVLTIKDLILIALKSIIE